MFSPRSTSQTHRLDSEPTLPISKRPDLWRVQGFLSKSLPATMWPQLLSASVPFGDLLVEVSEVYPLSH
ncbi:hypothetical protein SprV_0200960800 [Sparganum proliferum]